MDLIQENKTQNTVNGQNATQDIATTIETLDL